VRSAGAGFGGPGDAGDDAEDGPPIQLAERAFPLSRAAIRSSSARLACAGSSLTGGRTRRMRLPRVM
jgi:hypothetical protein